MEIVKAIAGLIFIITAILFVVSTFLLGCFIAYNAECYTLEWYSGLGLALIIAMFSCGLIYITIDQHGILMRK